MVDLKNFQTQAEEGFENPARKTPRGSRKKLKTKKNSFKTKTSLTQKIPFQKSNAVAVSAIAGKNRHYFLILPLKIQEYLDFLVYYSTENFFWKKDHSGQVESVLTNLQEKI